MVMEIRAAIDSDLPEEQITALTDANRLRNEENDLLAAFLRRNKTPTHRAEARDSSQSQAHDVEVTEGDSRGSTGCPQAKEMDESHTNRSDKPSRDSSNVSSGETSQDDATRTESSAQSVSDPESRSGIEDESEETTDGDTGSEHIPTDGSNHALAGDTSGHLTPRAEGGLDLDIGRFSSMVDAEADALHAMLPTSKRAEIAKNEVKCLKEETALLETNAEKDIDALKTVLEESRIRLNELRKESYEMQRHLVMNAGSVAPNFAGGKAQQLLNQELENTDQNATGALSDPKFGANAVRPAVVSGGYRSAAPNAQKVLTYWQEKIKAKDALVDKLKSKNHSLRTQIIKTDGRMKQKDQAGEGLHPIDLAQLKIENTQYNEKIAEKNQELLRLKMTAGKTVQVLNQAKRQLSEVVTHSAQLRTDIAEHRTAIERRRAELDLVRSDLDSEKRKCAMLGKACSGSENLQVTDYVNQQSRLHDLELEIGKFQRKIEIAQVSV